MSSWIKIVGSTDPPRTTRRAARPRARGYAPHERSCSCAHKNKVRLCLPQRTGGWQFVVDPVTKQCLGAKEHVQNETLSDKLDIVTDVLAMDKVDPTILIHDDMCHYEAYAKKHNAAAHSSVRTWVVDKFHRKNHKCKKRTWTKAQQRQLKDVNSSFSEIFNGWCRPLNFFLNRLRPSSHRFWVEELILFYNDHRDDVDLEEFLRGRGNVASRTGTRG